MIDSGTFWSSRSSTHAGATRGAEIGSASSAKQMASASRAWVPSAGSSPKTMASPVVATARPNQIWDVKTAFSSL